jgi:hypothetical protein
LYEFKEEAKMKLGTYEGMDLDVLVKAIDKYCRLYGKRPDYSNGNDMAELGRIYTRIKTGKRNFMI